MGSKGKKEEDAYKRQADATFEEAKKVDPLEEAQRKFATDLHKWRMGEAGPIDVRKMPGGGVGIGLFEEAKRARDAGRIGRGLGTLADGANPTFATALDKEMGLERDLAASGQLEGYVDDSLSDLDAKMMGLSEASGRRRLSLADMAMQRYLGHRSTQKPSFLKQMALGLAQGAGQAATAAAI